MTTLFISHSSKDKAWAGQIHAALCERGYTRLFLSSHPDDGIPVGDKWEQTLWHRLRQSGAVIVLCTANWLASPWCVAEAMIARERGKRVFLLATGEVADDRQAKAAEDAPPTARFPDFLKDTQFMGVADVNDDDTYRNLWRRLEMLKQEHFPLPNCPYPGLAPFEETDAAVYFGRDNEIDEVIAVLNRRRRNNAVQGFVLVLGASGCGKSSLVRAGVLPRLRRDSGDDGAPTAWVIAPPFLGGRGLDGLALALAQTFKAGGHPRDLAAIRGRLAAAGEVRSLGNELLDAHGAADGAVLLVLDQLEEVFATPEGSEQRALLRLLLDASADSGSPLLVLATMRSDFLNAFQLFEGAAERYEKITLDPMPRSRFAEVIEGPADRFGLDLDPGLAERMANETAYNDALPLLAFTLEKLYETCKTQGRLTLKAYDALGGVAAAIRHAADAILKETGYAGLSAEAPRMRDLRRAFYSLARVGDEGQFTRRTARWSQMPASCERVLQRFVEDRLLVSGAQKEQEGGEEEKTEPVIGVAHEALFRVWDTLNGWLEQDRKQLLLRAQIEAAAAAWGAETRPEVCRDLVWPEGRIVDAVEEIAKSGVSLDDVKDRATVDAFLGPSDPEQLETLPSLGEAEDATAGSGRYGEAWRLPLGHEARASAGVRLALLGDRRKGVWLRADGLPDLDWLPIKGGEVTIEIRANPDDPNSEVVKRLTRSVGPFWMARHPVTIAQFRVFLNECHQQDGWHLPPGFPIELSADYPVPKHRARYDNHPADSVNWYDSLAFCHWLSARLKFEVRLPTEYEWQQAATGGEPARTYPWGPAWDPATEPWRANTAESELGRSTAVGMYPAGVSPADILDMAGTLWEWCFDPFETLEARGGTWLGRLVSKPSVEEARHRVLRGGSWVGVRATPVQPTATGTARATGATTSVSVWCVRPHLRALITDSAAQAARKTARSAVRVSLTDRLGRGPAGIVGSSSPASPPVGPPVYLSAVCCAAGPGTTIRTTPVQPTATGTTRTTGTTTSVSVWCVRPHLSGPSRPRRLRAPQRMRRVRNAGLSHLQDCPPTTVCGPRRGRKDGAGASRPHGQVRPGRRAHREQGRRPDSLPRRPASVARSVARGGDLRPARP